MPNGGIIGDEEMTKERILITIKEEDNLIAKIIMINDDATIITQAKTWNELYQNIADVLKSRCEK